MKKWHVSAVRAAKGKQKLGCCTAYDACFARLADEAGVPIVLVGASMGTAMLAEESTMPRKVSQAPSPSSRRVRMPSSSKAERVCADSSGA